MMQDITTLTYMYIDTKGGMHADTHKYIHIPVALHYVVHILYSFSWLRIVSANPRP